MIDKNILTKKLSHQLGLKTELFEKISYSTNDRVKELIIDGHLNSLVIAESQEGGRGRARRSWVSTLDSVALSFSIRPNIDVADFPKITPLVADAVAEVLGDKISIKWPNDILINGKKVCGILCELFKHNGVSYVVVGIGINVGAFDFESVGIKDATSLKGEGIFIPKEDIISGIYNLFLKKMEVFEKEGFAPFTKGYSKKLCHIGREVIILDSSTHSGNIDEADVVIEGICEGVNDNGELIVKSEDKTFHISTGELSLRVNKF